MPSPNTVRIRPARHTDLAALVALERRCFRSDRISSRQYRHHLQNPHAALRVVPGGELELIGSVLVLFRSSSRVARLYSLAVDPQARGRGLGAALLAAAESLARQHGAALLRLEVRQDNPAAIALYESRGYRRIGARTAYYEDGTDAWRYERLLSLKR